MRALCPIQTTSLIRKRLQKSYSKHSQTYEWIQEPYIRSNFVCFENITCLLFYKKKRNCLKINQNQNDKWNWKWNVILRIILFWKKKIIEKQKDAKEHLCFYLVLFYSNNHKKSCISTKDYFMSSVSEARYMCVSST